MKRYKQKEWRRRPRKDVNGLRVARISFRVTHNERDALDERARKAGYGSLADFLVCRGLGRRERVKYSDQP